MGQSSLILILLSTFFQNVACLCVWQATVGKIVEDTQWGAHSDYRIAKRQSAPGIHSTNDARRIFCDTVLECEQKCEAFQAQGDMCNYFIRNSQTRASYLFYIDPAISRTYRDGRVDGFTFDSYYRFCEAEVSTSPTTPQTIPNACQSDEDCLCVWQATLGEIVQHTEPGGFPDRPPTGIRQTNYGYTEECYTLPECKEKCVAHGAKNCNHFIRSRQTLRTIFYYIEPTASRVYRDGLVNNRSMYDSYDRLCGAAASLSPKALQFIRDKCKKDEHACQPSAQQLATALAQRKNIERLLYDTNPTINKTFDKVRDAKRAFWAWIGFPNMTVLDNGLTNGDEILNYEQAQAMENFYRNRTSPQPTISHQLFAPASFPIAPFGPIPTVLVSPRKKRALFIDFRNNYRGQKWPSTTIKYKFDYSTGINPTQVQAIRTALNWLQRPRTCLNFVQDPNVIQYHGIVFQRGARGVGCSGHVGMQSVGLNYVIFDDSCATPGHLAHEIMHNLGVRHEHQRPDRDGYISLVLENLDPAMLDETQILANQNLEIDDQTIAYDTKYDYSSVMHYPNRAAAKANLRSGLYTILTTNSSAQATIGQRTSVSAADISTIIKAYGCMTNCVYSEWSSWNCLTDNDIYRKNRSRTILSEPSYGGNICRRTDMTQTKSCRLSCVIC